MVFKLIKRDSFLARLYPELSRFKDDLERGSALSDAAANDIPIQRLLTGIVPRDGLAIGDVE